MSRRILAIAVSAVIAVIAALLIIRYVGQADDRALSGLSPDEVLVVTETVPEGTAAEALDEYVSVEEVPASTVAPDALRSLDHVAGQVTVSELYPGEQVLSARFISPQERTSVDVPEGYHEVTIQLPKTRVLGGHLAVGDTVGLFASSYDRDDQTKLLLHKVLVTKVQGGAIVTTTEDGTEDMQDAADALMVTLAVQPSDAVRVINAAEFHGIWLSLEPTEAPEGISTIDREDLFG